MILTDPLITGVAMLVPLDFINLQDEVPDAEYTGLPGAIISGFILFPSTFPREEK